MAWHARPRTSVGGVVSERRGRGVAVVPQAQAVEIWVATVRHQGPGRRRWRGHVDVEMSAAGVAHEARRLLSLAVNSRCVGLLVVGRRLGAPSSATVTPGCGLQVHRRRPPYKNLGGRPISTANRKRRRRTRSCAARRACRPSGNQPQIRGRRGDFRRLRRATCPSVFVRGRARCRADE